MTATMGMGMKAILFLLLSVVLLWMVYGMEWGEIDVGFGKGRYLWQQTAAVKRNENMAKIPSEWLLPKTILDGGKRRRKIAGDFIEGLLDPETQRITGSDNDEILELVRNGSLTALQVTKAFCKRGAYAHQLVRTIFFVF